MSKKNYANATVHCRNVDMVGSPEFTDPTECDRSLVHLCFVGILYKLDKPFGKFCFG